MNVDDRASSLLVWEREVKLSIKPTRPSECGVNGVWSVRSSYYNDLATAVHAVHEREQRGNNGGMNLLLFAGSDGSKSYNGVLTAGA